MPLFTEIHRDGEAREINWGWWHVERMQEVAICELLNIPDAEVQIDGEFWTNFQSTELAQKGTYTVQRDHYYLDENDGEKFTILAGDVLVMHR